MMVSYVSTRGGGDACDFEQVLLTGLAPDGGLFVPDRWPVLAAADMADLAGCAYAGAAARIMAPFMAGHDDNALSQPAIAEMARAAYGAFTHPATAPLVEIDANLWLLELFHGPTLAFKDFALQLLGRLFDRVLAARGERITIVGATSGDTGSAAIHGCMGRDNIEIFILHPEGRVSDVQRRQMTTVTATNVHNIAIKGTFDDCQALVKAMFNDARFRAELNLSAINSINWARVMAQTVYYFYAAVALGAPHRPVSFAVPTGNFGDVYAGYAAAQMGLPLTRLIVATNRNDILTRWLDSGRYQTAQVKPTISPSMDIQVASNFERLLFDLCDRDGRAVGARMDELTDRGGFEIGADRMARARSTFGGARIDEAETLAEIRRVHGDTGLIIDPHSAVGVAAARRMHRDSAIPMIALATAHPAKFPDAVLRAIGMPPPVPPPLRGLGEADEHYTMLDRDLAAVQDYIRASAWAADR